jgi:hypothetical protein
MMIEVNEQVLILVTAMVCATVIIVTILKGILKKG